MSGRASRLQTSSSREVMAWLLFAVSLGAMEGGVVSVMVKTFYRQAVGAATLDYMVALLVGAPLFANIASLGWAAVGPGPGASRLLVQLQVLCVVCLLLVAAAPRNAAGLAMVVAGAVTARLLWSGVATLRSSVWRLCYGREARAALAGRVVAVHYFAIAATGVAVGALVDRWPAALPALYLLIAGFGLGGALLYRALCRGGDPELALRGEAEAQAERKGLLRTFAGILRADTGFRRYLTWLFVLDSGVQMMTAPVLICLADRFSLTRIEQTLLITAVPMVVVPMVMPLFARRLSQVHVIRFRAFHSWFYAASLAFSTAGLALHATWCLWLGAALLGVGYAGGSITWHIGHHDFAPPALAPHYMSLNVALSGVRGVLVPVIGVSLYRLAEHLLPGTGPLALLVPLGLAVWGSLGFVAMAREPFSIEEGRTASPPSQPKALPWAKETRPSGPNSQKPIQGGGGPEARVPLAQGNALGWKGVLPLLVLLAFLLPAPLAAAPPPGEIHLAVTACGDRLDKALVMLESATRSARGHLTFHIFADDVLRPLFQERLNAWPPEVRAKFTAILYPIRYPGVADPEKWRGLFKPCASERLFYPYLIESTDRVLYVDTDILFLRPIDDLWSFFDQLKPEQIAALAPEGENPDLNWYKRFAQHPYVQPLGVNSGVMLMDLKKMREVRWRERMLAYREKYTHIPWGDQDLINIFFAESPEKLFVFSCEWNFRPDHCEYGSNCKAAEERGISVVHGNRQSFHTDKQPTFKAVYEAFAQHKSLADGLAAVAGKSECGKVSKLFTKALAETTEKTEKEDTGEDLDFYHDVAVAQLAPWRTAGIRRQDLDAARALDRPLVKYQVLGGRLYRDAACYFPARCQGIEHFLLEIAPRLPDVEFLVNVQDHPVTRSDSPLPVFSFSKIPSEHADILYPAWAFWEGGPALAVIPTWRWDVSRKDLLAAGEALSWQEKKPVLFFRGSRTNASRDPYVLHAQTHPDLWDVRYVLNQSQKETEYVTQVLKIAPAEPVSPRDHCAYRYLLNFDGVAASFRLKNLLACGGLVFYVEPKWVEFFYSKLVPGEHYIPLSLDVDEAARTVASLQADDARAQKIAHNGRDFIEKHLTLAHVRRYWLDLLGEYASLQRFQPRRDPSLVLIH